MTKPKRVEGAMPMRMHVRGSTAERYASEGIEDTIVAVPLTMYGPIFAACKPFLSELLPLRKQPVPEYGPTRPQHLMLGKSDTNIIPCLLKGLRKLSRLLI